MVKRISPLSATPLERFFFLCIRGLCSPFIVKLSAQQGQNVYTVPRYAWPAARGYCAYILPTKIDSRVPKSPMTSLFASSCDEGHEMMKRGKSRGCMDPICGSRYWYTFLNIFKSSIFLDPIFWILRFLNLCNLYIWSSDINLDISQNLQIPKSLNF